MKLIIDRAALLRGLGHIQSVVERKTTIPILSNVLLKAEGGQLSFTATDMDLEIRETVPSDAETEGGATVPAHTLYDIARKLRETAKIEIQTDAGGRSATIRSGRSTFQLPTLPAEDYPVMSGGEFTHVFRLPSQEVKDLVDRTRFAMSTEETRYYLNGINFHAAEIEGVRLLRAAATDGHRLSRAETALPPGAEGMPSIILPRKTTGELRKLLDDASGEIEISLSPTKIRFAFGDVVLTSKLIDGVFPDYERVIPAANPRSLLLDAKMLAEAVDRVSTISTEKSRAVKFEIAPDTVVVSSVSPDAGSAVEELEAEYKGEGLEIGFNARYLLDIIAQIPEGKVSFALDHSSAPALLRDADDASAVWILMPLRV